MCIWQYEESVLHLFNFVKACWESIVIVIPQSNNMKRVIMMLKRRITEPFFMEVIPYTYISMAHLNLFFVHATYPPSRLIIATSLQNNIKL
jgi:hypothetical protein